MDDSFDTYRRSPLHYAAAEGQAAVVRRFLAAGVDPNRSDRADWTPLHFAAQANSAESVAALIEAGAEVDPRDEHGNTPLFRAVFNSRGEGDVIVLLRAHGADPHAVNRHGVSPLALARKIANYDVRQHFADIAAEGALHPAD